MKLFKKEKPKQFNLNAEELKNKANLSNKLLRKYLESISKETCDDDTALEKLRHMSK